MPNSWRHRGESRQDEAFPRRILRFIEPCLLLLLHCREVHGYDLVEGLHSFGFEQSAGGSSTVYRVLRELEQREFVTSRWDTANSGPARRLYRLTARGDAYLASWAEDLRETDRVLHSFLSNYDRHMEQHA